MPLINDFLVRMRDSHEWLAAAGRQAEADAVQKVLEFRLRAASAAYYVPLDLENIEELFSLASASAGDMDAAIRVAIAATIDFSRHLHPLEECRLFLRQSGTSPSFFIPPLGTRQHSKYPDWLTPVGELDAHNPDRNGPFAITRYAFIVARLLGMFVDGRPHGQNTFITFNYDTVLEDGLRELRIPFHYDFGESYESTPEGDISQLPPVPVLKLHGSVNWGRNAAGPLRQALKIYPDLAAMLTAKAQPTLVPPTWKKIFGGPLEAVWDSAVDKLSTATRVIIIGFSMPPADMHFKFLMAAGLKSNVSLRRIVFVNPDGDGTLRQRAEQLLRKSVLEFAKVELGTFTQFSVAHMRDLNRPGEDGLSGDLFPSSESASVREREPDRDINGATGECATPS